VHRPNNSRLRKVSHWLALRDARYIVMRLVTLVRRYGLTPVRAKARVLRCMQTLNGLACWPTFFTPGQVVAWNGPFCRDLQRLGAELAVHGYQHVDFRGLSGDEAQRQFARAATAYDHHTIGFEGFRCPYLSYTAPLADLALDRRLVYSSNRAIWWDVVASASAERAGRNGRAALDLLARCYQPLSAATHPAIPEMTGRLIEIPVCLPDDLQLLDGLKLDAQGVQQAWLQVLQHTHQRGELFDRMFHPESFELCSSALEAVVRTARSLAPPVWVTQLREVSRWWREKSRFSVEWRREEGAAQLAMHCSDRATVLVRHVEIRERSKAWYGPYRVLEGRTLRWDSDVTPFIGLAPDTPANVASFLRDQGYVVERGPDAARCATYLTAVDLEQLQNRIELTDFIEASATPLVRFWRWPDNARSALCITGDLDALSLMDYLARVFAF
jgi:hypothetical protein